MTIEANGIVFHGKPPVTITISPGEPEQPEKKLILKPFAKPDYEDPGWWDEDEDIYDVRLRDKAPGNSRGFSFPKKGVVWRQNPMAEKAPNPYLIKQSDGSFSITPEGEAHLQKIVTDTKGSVYAFTGESSPIFAAAAMARLSRRGSDLREIYLDEFAAVGAEGAEALIDRVVTGYGDDSVQQLITVSTVVEGASNLLTKKIEWSRLA